jgi:hypothetical protein
MNGTITYTTRDAQVPWPALLAEQLEHWRSLTTVIAAEVILEQRRADKGSFRVKVRLEVSGLGLRSEVSDTTLETALLMATRDLKNQVEARKTNDLGRERSQ